MGNISSIITKAAQKAARDQIDKALKREGYMTREELATKYNIEARKIWRWTKKGLPYNQELKRIKESDFIKWLEENPIRPYNMDGRIIKK